MQNALADKLWIVPGAAMMAKGVEFEQQPKKEHWGTSAIFRDSEGNKFVLSSR